MNWIIIVLLVLLAFSQVGLLIFTLQKLKDSPLKEDPNPRISLERVYMYKAHYTCTCGKGEMVATGKVLPMNPPLYEHKCTVCELTENLSTTYPTIAYNEA